MLVTYVQTTPEYLWQIDDGLVNDLPIGYTLFVDKLLKILKSYFKD